MKEVTQALDAFLDWSVVLGYGRVGCWVRRLSWNPAELDLSLQDRVCIVTGANSGLGLETALGLAARGARVTMVCRDAERGRAARDDIVRRTGNPHVELAVVNLASQRQVRAFARSFLEHEQRLDILVNNAGILPHDRVLTEDGLEQTFAVNTLAYFLLTNLFEPLLRSTAARFGQARVINVSSGGMYLAKLDLDDLQFARSKFDGVLAYARTKRAELYLTALWAELLREQGIFVACMHPGWADTPGVRNSLPVFRSVMQLALRTPAEGADTVLWLAINPALRAADGGGFYADRRTRPFHRLESTRASAEELRRLWDECARLSDYDGPLRVDDAVCQRVAALP